MADALTVALGKIGDGAALDEQDWETLTGARELIALGVAADEARRRRHANRVTFVQVAEVPLAGVVEPDAARDQQVGELRLTGRPSTAAAAVTAVRAAVTQVGSVPVTGFALDELFDVCQRDHGRLGELLAELREAGLALVSELAADALPDPTPVFAALRASGLAVSRLTCGGTVGSAAHALARRVGRWEGAGDVCRSFAPLPRVEPSPPSTGYGDLRQVALARLLVDNIDSIQVDWARHGPKLAQVALTFGADDIDAMFVADSADQGWRRSPLEEIRRNIAAAGFVAVARTGRFDPLDGQAQEA